MRRLSFKNIVAFAMISVLALIMASCSVSVNVPAANTASEGEISSQPTSSAESQEISSISEPSSTPTPSVNAVSSDSPASVPVNPEPVASEPPAAEPTPSSAAPETPAPATTTGEITEEKAKQMYLEAYPDAPIDICRLENSDGGKKKWYIMGKADGYKYEMVIDAQNGQIYNKQKIQIYH